VTGMRDALQAFLEHRPKKAGNVESTGTVLLSYGWWEMAKWVEGEDGRPEVVVRTGLSYSPSTKRQGIRLGLYRWRKAEKLTPRGQGAMEV
jgi:hypothetical protein